MSDLPVLPYYNKYSKRYRQIQYKISLYRKGMKYYTQKAKEWKKRNPEKVKDSWTKYNNKTIEKRKTYYLNNKEIISLKKHEYRKKNITKHIKWAKEYYEKNKFRIALKNREQGRVGKNIPEDRYIAMLNVRIRDKNTCQWYGCGLKHKITPIHVHHIFPINEYPQFELVEKYMICYCAEHHAQFHALRGDHYYKLIKSPRKLICNINNESNQYNELEEVV